MRYHTAKTQPQTSADKDGQYKLLSAFRNTGQNTPSHKHTQLPLLAVSRAQLKSNLMWEDKTGPNTGLGKSKHTLYNPEIRQ